MGREMNPILLSKSKCLCILFLAMVLTGCESTLRQQKEGQLTVLNEIISKTQITLKEIKSGELPPHYDVHIFLSHDVLNKGLSALDNYEFALPNDPTITIVIRNIRIANYGAVPTVFIDAVAKKNSLSAEVDLTAVFLPVTDANARPGDFKVGVLKFVPKIKWVFFEFTKIEFVRALLATELAKITEKLPVVRLPLAQGLKMGGAASSKTETIRTSEPAEKTEGSTLDIRIDIPSSQRNRKVVITNYVFLKTGIHAFGVLQ